MITNTAIALCSIATVLCMITIIISLCNISAREEKINSKKHRCDGCEYNECGICLHPGCVEIDKIMHTTDSEYVILWKDGTATYCGNNLNTDIKCSRNHDREE